MILQDGTDERRSKERICFKQQRKNKNSYIG